MKVEEIHAKTILTKQAGGGFLSSPPFPFTHSLSPYTGCSLGKTACGAYCYAPSLPSWMFRRDRSATWGAGVWVKRNAAAVLDAELASRSGTERSQMRVFMSSTTDPYQPLEKLERYRITRRCLEVFACYADPRLLVIQTRSTLARDDFDLLGRIPYAWLSVTIESDDAAMMERLGAWPPIDERFTLVADAAKRGIPTQITVAPCLPHTPALAERLAASGARRVVVDTFVDGDGAGGARTSKSRFAQIAASPAWAGSPLADWRNIAHAQGLYRQLQALGVAAGWSAAGFCGIE